MCEKSCSLPEGSSGREAPFCVAVRGTEVPGTPSTPALYPGHFIFYRAPEGSTRAALPPVFECVPYLQGASGCAPFSCLATCSQHRGYDSLTSTRNHIFANSSLRCARPADHPRNPLRTALVPALPARLR